MDAKRACDVVLTDPSAHQQQRFSTLHHPFLSLNRADRCLYGLALRGRQNQLPRSRAGGARA
jgi:hypothetical protein